jgi:predicted DNA-binding WGR domain protein
LSARRPGSENERVRLYRIDHACNIQRFYRLDVHPDLFGEFCLIREWGQLRTRPYPSPEAASDALERQRRAKERRGYC